MRKVYVDTGKRKEKIVYEEYNIENSFIQTYLNSSDLFFKIRSHCASSLLIWIIINMKPYNQITLNKSNRSDFISSLIEKGGNRYADDTVRHAMRELISVGAIISFNNDKQREASYMVNPAYFWKTKEQKDRLETIKAFENKRKENERN